MRDPKKHGRFHRQVILRPVHAQIDALESEAEGVDSSGHPAAGGGVRSEPEVRQQLVEPPCRMGRKATKDVGEEGERVDVEMLAGAGQEIQDRRRPAATGTPQKCPILAFLPRSA